LLVVSVVRHWPDLGWGIHARKGLRQVTVDPKNAHADHRPRIYVPANDPLALRYFTAVARQQQQEEEGFPGLEVGIVGHVPMRMYSCAYLALFSVCAVRFVSKARVCAEAGGGVGGAGGGIARRYYARVRLLH
jgi:hypothetical protein